MSAMAGYHCYAGRQSEPSTLSTLGNLLGYFGPDGCSSVQTDDFGMLHRPHHTSERDRRFTQPATIGNGSFLTWDGRLDNADTLARALGISASVSGDAELVLHAYDRWGADFISRIVGDFALAIWDPHHARVLFARDPFGIKRLYYVLSLDRLVWASSVSALLPFLEKTWAIDDEFIAGYLTTGPGIDRTAFTGIDTALPGHLTVVSRGTVSKRSFWQATPGKEIRYSTDGQYEEHFRSLFRESVRYRLNSDVPVCSELSGGLDSSAMVGMADEIIAAQECPAPSLTTVSYVFDTSPCSDERHFIQTVEQRRGRRGWHLREEDGPILSLNPYENFLDCPSPMSCFGGRCLQVADAMKAEGARVLLRGEGGDQVLWGEVKDPFELADLLQQFRIPALLRCAKAWGRAQRRSVPELLWKAALIPCLPSRLRALSVPNRQAQLLNWVMPEFAARTSFRDKLLGLSSRDERPFSSPSNREENKLIQELIAVIASGCAGYYPPQFPIECRFPYLHIPLVEFLLAIPIDQKLRPGVTRSLMRRSLKGVLPPAVATRTDKRGPDEAFYRAVRREWPNLAQLFSGDARVCRYGYVTRNALVQALRSARHGLASHGPFLLRVISLELWLRSVDKASPNTLRMPSGNSHSISAALCRRQPITGVTRCDDV